MNAEEYHSLVAELVAKHPPETAARLLEQKCRPPYPPERPEDEAEGGAA